MGKIKITIYPDGYIQTETVGIKGKKCEDYIPLFKKLLMERVADQIHTEEYYEQEEETYQNEIGSVRNG